MNNDSKHLAGIRDRLGLSQRDVADHIGVTPSLISHWERGEREPSGSQWLALAGVYGVPHDYLRNPVIRPQFQCRTQMTLTADEKAATLHALVAGESQVHALNKAWEMAGSVPSRLALSLEYAEPQLADLANQLRMYLKLNMRVTFEELKESAQEQGIRIFEWHLPPKLSGFSYRGAFTVVFVNRDHPESRRLFTLAHELAHVLFHLGHEQETAVSVMASTRDPLEKEANAFASELLMPRCEMERVLKDFGPERMRDPMVMKQAAEFFHVSVPALFYRLSQLGVVSWKDKSRYFAKGSRGQLPEHLITMWDRQVDEKLAEILLRLLQSEKITTGKVAEWSSSPRFVVEQFLEELSKGTELPAELFEAEDPVP